MKTKFTILLFLLLSFQIGKSQLAFDFISNFNTCCESSACNINFYPLSPDPLTSWNWDFGDGSISTLEFPSHIYNITGQYTVTLIVSNGIETDTLIKFGYIEIYPSPIVDFTYNISGDTVQFIDQSGVTSVTWHWNLGNGTTANYINPVTTYPYPPDSCYDVTLTVINTYNCVDSLTKTICITSIEELAAKNITIYPSPIINNQKLIVKGNINGLGNIIGYDVLGNLISLPFISKNENELIFETNQLDKGVYFLQLHFNDKTVVTKKIVVQ